MTATREELEHLLEKRIAVLDGAMGTLIQTHQLGEADFRGERFRTWSSDVKGNSDLLVLTQPDLIGDIHDQFLEAGADLIETNTFTSTRIAQADYGMEELAYEMSVRGAQIARQRADAWSVKGKRRYVAGSIGPMNRTLSISPRACSGDM